MAIEMVRIPSETPNISNTDDFVGLRYAYGNQNGYVIGKGQECSYTISGAKFRVNSGRLVLQGVECDVDANGVEITVDNVATKKYYTVYLQVNLATNETKILAMSDTTGYPTIESGNDLTQNTTGTATMELYHFEATSGVISNVQKIVQKIDYTGTALVGYDISKGTVEERLDTLGFSEDSISVNSNVLSNYTVRSNSIKKLGKFVIFNLGISYKHSDYTSIKLNSLTIGNIPTQYIPSSTKNGTTETFRVNNISQRYIKSGYAEFITTGYNFYPVNVWIGLNDGNILIKARGTSDVGNDNIETLDFKVAWIID